MVKNFLDRVLVIATLALTLLSQIPKLESKVRPAMYLIWLLMFVVGLVGNGFKIRTNRFLNHYIGSFLIIIVECFLCFFLFQTHLNSYFLRVFPLPILCYLIGSFLVNKYDKATEKRILVIYLVITSVVFIYIFNEYIGSINNWFYTTVYIYEKKNSAPQIIASAMILGIFLLNYKNRALQMIKYIDLSVLLIIMVTMQCRAALISLVLTAVIYSLVIANQKWKVIFVCVAIIGGTIVFSNNVLASYVMKAFVTNSRQMQSFDNFTSGRMTLYGEALEHFANSIWVGTGHYRVDDLYICLLSDIGLIGFCAVISLWLHRILLNINAFIKENTLFTRCLLCLTFFYIGESIFEAYPPFGPGVCSFMFWILSAMLDYKDTKLTDKR